MAVPAFALLLFAGHKVIGPDESYNRLLDCPTSWLGGASIPAARFLASDPMTSTVLRVEADPLPRQRDVATTLTPEARIRSVFAQFGPGERRAAHPA
ncbi:MAG TPA: hypothetical protein VFL62_09365 [Bradyrhizobium sp.]|uniref:hypothetical protein n=1 Tax=Bradyrhizobium sp. TaxID=376 RepID=UPI002D7FB179|nr:hypothetical protein [Bradyrhizobium sp.]HET7886421.1 hypothetical protein [Bradyrhizobium sp.]